MNYSELGNWIAIIILVFAILCFIVVSLYFKIKDKFDRTNSWNKKRDD